MSINESSADYLVIGGGSAGTVIASELARAGHSTWLLEAGARPGRLPPTMARPADYLRLQGKEWDWAWRTSRQESLAGRILRWPRGKGIGGCSLINAMIVKHALPQDWQAWRDLAGERWSGGAIGKWREKLDRRLEGWIEPVRSASLATRAAIAAAEATFGPKALELHHVMCRKGERVTVPMIFEVDGPTAPSRLRVIPNVQIERLKFGSSSAMEPTVTGVITRDGSTISATRGVILCAGAIGSPMLLLESGIGPRETLQDAGVEVHVESPRVGLGLTDHLVVPIIFNTPAHWRFPTHWSRTHLRSQRELGRGPAASNLAEASGLLNGPALDPDRVAALQWFVTPTHYLLHPDPKAPSAMTIAIVGGRPRSRGQLTVRRGNRGLEWMIDPRYLTHDADWETLLEGVRRVRALSRSLAERGVGEEMLPGGERADEGDLRRFVARFAQTLYHPVGTCAMGVHPEAVTDPKGAVRGIARLWVVDGASFPAITSVNPHATVLLHALRASEEILNATQ